MKFLMIGDIVGDGGMDMATTHIPELREKYGIDFCIANGENASPYNGITRKRAERLLDAGVDVVTLGNHTFRQKETASLLHNNERVIRPLNYPDGTPGSGVCVATVGGTHVAVLNATGRVYMDYMDCPFHAVDRALSRLSADAVILDFHAEATSEKISMGYYLDGRVSAVLGTHTHVQTADAKILPRGTGYLTDVGMTGPYYSCLGVKKEITLERFLTCVPQRFETADGPSQLNGVYFEVEDGKTVRIETVALLPPRR